jgi:hypothetical protein
MDEFVRVPGTQFRFGLDPLILVNEVIGIVPIVGDTFSF